MVDIEPNEDTDQLAIEDRARPVPNKRSDKELGAERVNNRSLRVPTHNQAIK